MRIAVLVLMLVFFVNVQPASAQVNATLVRSLKGDPQQKYYMYLPENFNPLRVYPLLIAVHWYTGTALGQVENWHHFSSRDQYILLCPQFKDGYQTMAHDEDKVLMRIMDEVAQDFRFDRSRVYLTGCSGGGQFAHRFVFKHPGLIKAVGIVASGSYVPPPVKEELKKVKFFVGVGENDTERLPKAQYFYKQLLGRKYDAQLKIFPGIAHSCGIDTQVSVADYFQHLN